MSGMRPSRIIRRYGLWASLASLIAFNAKRPPLTEVGWRFQLASISSRIKRLVSLSSTISTRRCVRSAIRCEGFGCLESGLEAKVGYELKHAAFARSAFHPDSAAHYFHELMRNGQSQPCPAMAPGCVSVGLNKGVENGLRFSLPGFPAPCPIR